MESETKIHVKWWQPNHEFFFLNTSQKNEVSVAGSLCFVNSAEVHIAVHTNCSRSSIYSKQNIIATAGKTWLC